MNDKNEADFSMPMAAIDLGSNSFHMIIAQKLQGELRTLDKRGEKVQLAAGLNEHGYLSEEAMQRGIECLRGFAKHLRGFKPESVSVLATNALRVARNRSEFIARAEEVLGFQIEISKNENLTDSGIELGKTLQNDSSLDIYTIYNKDFNDSLLVKVFDKTGQEIGRQKTLFSGKKDAAHYVNIEFDSRTNIDYDSKVTIEKM